MTPGIYRAIRRRGGLAATFELHRDGFDRAAIARFVRRGAILRIRQGWYAEPDIDAQVAAAARVGGRLSCLSRLAAAGLWVIEDGALHVAVERNDCQLRDPVDRFRRLSPGADVRVHWGDPGHRIPLRSRLETDLVTALTDAGSCLGPELLTAAADSVLRSRPPLRAELRARAGSAPERVRTCLLRADGVCESGIETIFWLRMRPLAPRRQVVIPAVGRVDFLFGDRLVVETDGRAHHSEGDAFEADRRRDAILSSLGYRTLRFSYHQVMSRWTEVDAAVRAAIARGDRF